MGKNSTAQAKNMLIAEKENQHVGLKKQSLLMRSKPALKKSGMQMQKLGRVSALTYPKAPKYLHTVKGKLNASQKKRKGKAAIFKKVPTRPEILEIIVEETATNGNSSPTMNGQESDAEMPLDVQSELTEECQNVANQTTQPLFAVCHHKQQVLALIAAPLSFYGALKVTLIAGSICVSGYKPYVGQQLEIFSPRGWSHIKIVPEAIKESDDDIAECCATSNDAFLAAFLPHMLEILAALEHGALLLLERIDESKSMLDVLSEQMREQIFPRASALGKSTSPVSYRESELVLGCSFNVNETQTLEMQAQYVSLMDKFSAAVQDHISVKMLFAGGKAVGKSSMLRYAVNRFLSEGCDNVLVIDLDMGQPEIYVPETVSLTLVSKPLLGPACFKRMQPLEAYYTGSNDIVNLGPEEYVRLLQKLAEYITSQPAFDTLPWVINTMGYNKGFGAEIMAVICDIFRPTVVLEMLDSRSINNFDVPMTPEQVRNMELVTLPKFKRSPAHLHYEHVQLAAHVTPESLQSYKFNLNSKAKRFVILLAHLSGAIARCMQGKFTNIRMEDFTVFVRSLKLEDEQERWRLLRGNLVFLCNFLSTIHAEDKYYKCVGLGIVQEVDFNNRQLRLAHTLPYADSLPPTITILACGKEGLPSSLKPQRLYIQDAEQPVQHEFAMPHSALSKGVQQFYSPQGRARKF